MRHRKDSNKRVVFKAYVDGAASLFRPFGRCTTTEMPALRAADLLAVKGQDPVAKTTGYVLNVFGQTMRREVRKLPMDERFTIEQHLGRDLTACGAD